MSLKTRLALAFVISTLGLGVVTQRAHALDGGVAAARAPRVIEITVEGGYHPERVVVTEGEPVQLRFVRKEYGGCTLEVVFPTLGIRQTLPTNQAVVIDLGTPAAGEIPFHCGMKMIQGVLVVQPKEGA